MVALSQAAAAAAAAFQAFSSPASVQRSFNTSRLSVILSLPPCISPLPPRVWALASSSTPPASSGSPIDAHATRHRQRTGFNIGCSKYGVGIRSAAEVKETKGPGLKAEQAAPARPEAVAAPSALPEAPPGHSITFLTVASEEELLSSIWKEVEAKRIPPRAGHGMEGLYYNYRDAVLDSGVSRGKEMVVQIMATVLDRILLQFEEPFTFPSHHKAIREPYDYYIFGQNYIRPLVDFRNSYLGNVSRFNDVEQQLKQGHNVILFANHQTEADPAVMALLLESSHPYLAENLTYIAGDRVVLDPFCKPFSMGRNLLCVYSKKHINDVPELVEMKRKANTRTLKELALLLRKGGQLIWIAPSGGRDRPNPDTDEWFPAHFDVASVENMRRLIEQSRAPGHMYPLALLCYDVMPPPRQVEKELGEKRLLGFTGVGLSIANELKFDEVTNDTCDREQAAKVFSEAIWEQVHKHYKVLNAAVYGGGGLAASTSSVSLSQPWSLNSKISRDKHAQPCNSI